MEGEKLMPDSVEAKIDAIRGYLQEHLYKADPDLRHYPKKGTIKLQLVTAAHDAATLPCELCGLAFVSGGLVLLVEYDKAAGDRAVVPVCANLKACQDRRDAKIEADLLEQQTIAETVILP